MKVDQDNCKVNRWDTLKQKLNNLKPAAFKIAIEGKSELYLIDCRKPEEFDTGHLPGAINLDYLSYDFLDDLELLNPEADYYVYCRSGRRSIRTCTLMQNSGFTSVYNLDGGLQSWEVLLGEHLLT